MRYVRELTLLNWGPFKGEHTIKLEPTVYAVTAQHHANQDRSNWIGKTWFLDSMLFALTGMMPDTCTLADDWITHGEAEGCVTLVADDGTVVFRGRKRGQSTKLVVKVKGKKKQQVQKVAQETLYSMMGMDGDDLLATSFIRQKQISRLITADPTTRTDIVNGWVELDPLQRAEQWLRDRLNGLLKEELQLAVGEAPEGEASELVKEWAQVDGTTGLRRLERDALQKQYASAGTWKQHEQLVGQFSELQRQGKALRFKVDAFKSPDVDALHAEAQAIELSRATALDREHGLRVMVNDDWDSKCPLTCEVCPVEGEVREIGVRMGTEHGEAEVVLDQVDLDAKVARDAHTAARAQQMMHEGEVRQLKDLRKRAAELMPSVRYIEDHDEVDTTKVTVALNQHNADIAQGERQLGDLEARIEAHRLHEDATQRVAQQRAELQGTIRTCREAIAVVGRQGAQREVAEAALFRIERGANELLQQSSIDLQVKVQWAREASSGLAVHCDTCGSVFSKSQKVKVCEICSAKRGPKRIEKLQIIPSDRSGAADDITGLGFQLAASAWLRAKRSASWSVTCIDEPFGALDAANCRALSTHLYALIRGNYAFAQGFLVAHNAAVMENLPARIRIFQGVEGITLEVVT